MKHLKADTELMRKLNKIDKKVGFLEKEVVKIRTWLTEDTMLTPSEKKLIDRTLKEVKTGEYKKLISHDELRKKLAV